MASRVNAEKVRGWIRRYLPAEVAGLSTALIAAAASMARWPHGLAQAALAAAIGEAFGFYGAFVWRQMRARHGLAPTARAKARQMMIILGGLVVEFGPAELVDTLFVRPVAMYAMELAFGGIMIGVLAGKIIADLVFYGLAVGAYELILRRLRGFADAPVPVVESAGAVGQPSFRRPI